MGVDGLNKFRQIRSWELRSLLGSFEQKKCDDAPTGCYLSTVTHAIPLSSDLVEIVGLNHIGEINEQYLFFKLQREKIKNEEFDYTLTLGTTISTVKMIFNNITTTTGGSLLCNSTLRYLTSDQNNHQKYTVARFCPMS